MLKSAQGFFKKHRGTIEKADRFTQGVLKEAEKYDIPGAKTALDLRKKASDAVKRGQEIAKTIKK